MGRDRHSNFRFLLGALVVALAYTPDAPALSVHFQNEISYRFTDRIYYNDTNPTVFESYDHYVHELLDMTVTHRGFTLDVRPELRFVSSDALDLPERDSARTIYRDDRRLMSLGNELSHANRQVLMSDVDRLYANYAGSNWQTTIGRSPLGIGNLRVLTLWNRFSASLFNTGTTELVFNPDLALLSGQWGKFSLGGIAITARLPADRITLAHAIYYGEWIELQAIGGQWWERPIGGLAFSKDVNGAQIRGESLLIGATRTEATESQIALGIENALSSKITVLMEWLYQQAGGQNYDDYANQFPSRFRPLLATAYVYGQLSFKATDFSTGDFGALVNLVDGSTLANVVLSYSLSDHFDIGAEARIPVGGQNQEFGRVRIIDLPPVDVGYPQRYSLRARAVF
jgi:hypothetical protein